MKLKSCFKLIIKKGITMCFVCVFTTSLLGAQNYNFKQLISNAANSDYTNIPDIKTMDAWVANQNIDGSWADMQYGKTALNGSLNNNHLHRLWCLSAVSSSSDNEKYNNTSYKSAIKKGLQFWYESKSIDSNWWFNRIYFPKRLGEILIFMREFDGFIPQTTSEGIDEPEIVSLFTPTRIKDITSYGTGANAIDMAMHFVYRGLLTKDEKLLVKTRDKIESILADNIKADMVYQDHGSQIMIASYGPVFCKGVIQMASILANSPAAFNTKSENFSKVIHFIKDTQTSSIRGAFWDYSTLGRGISRYNESIASMDYVQDLAKIDPENTEVYLDLLARIRGEARPDYKVKAFNKHYWVSDYTQHARSGYLFTVRNTSTRTHESETGNQENLKGNYLSYGANFMAIDGDEYLNIMPVWDWAMIPGTTFPHIETFLKRSEWGSNLGNTTFVGGVSNGNYGATVLTLDEVNIVAKKSWFFFDDEIVCLGAGITDNSNNNVRTTINQTWMQTPSFYVENHKNTEVQADLSSEVYQNSNLKYIRQGKFGYFFPNNNDIKFSMQTKTGAWETINKVIKPDKVETGDVFSLWIDHGENPLNATYSYILVPNIETSKKAETYDMNSVQILENTPKIQAVYHKKLNMLQAIFYQAGSVHFQNKSLSVNKPCALLFSENGEITISNPSQTYSDILVNLSDNDTVFSKVLELPQKII